VSATAEYVNLNRYLNTLYHQPQFVAVVGEVTQVSIEEQPSEAGTGERITEHKLRDVQTQKPDTPKTASGKSEAKAPIADARKEKVKKEKTASGQEPDIKKRKAEAEAGNQGKDKAHQKKGDKPELGKADKASKAKTDKANEQKAADTVRAAVEEAADKKAGKREKHKADKKLPGKSGRPHADKEEKSKAGGNRGEDKKEQEKKQERKPTPPHGGNCQEDLSHLCDEDDMPAVPKGKNALDLLPKSPMILDMVKKLMFTEKPHNPKFFDLLFEGSDEITLFDPAGYSVYTCHYKYNDEHTKFFLSCNLMGGFLQVVRRHTRSRLALSFFFRFFN